MTPTPELPHLPDPYTEQVIEYSGIAVNRVDRFPLFTADQMRAMPRLPTLPGLLLSGRRARRCAMTTAPKTA